jgi:DNA repair protein RadA/Sms
VCAQCGYETYKWLGRCPECEEWNTLIEEIRPAGKTGSPASVRVTPAVPLTEVDESATTRLVTGIRELDRVLGGGLVPGSLILLGGDPGIGKSTLLLQLAHHLAEQGKTALYLSAEESLSQIRLRSIRLGINNGEILLVNTPDLTNFETYLEEIHPEVVIIDSIQTVYIDGLSSLPGSVSQLRECTAKLNALAKKTGTAFFLVGHVTKDGALAGPKVLEHMVDVVIYFEGEKNYQFRILRAVKNRFGSTDEIGLLEMSGQGLIEVEDPSGIFLDAHESKVSGSSVVVSFEGSRALLIEVQTLVSSTGGANPRRMATGLDQNRFALILAVLEKRCGLHLSNNDVYLKVTGGVFLKDPSVDLGIAAAILSSYRDEPLPPATAFSGELSLSGEIRPIPFLNSRIREVEKMGFKQLVLPKGAYRKGRHEATTLTILPAANIQDMYGRLFP